MKWITSAVFFSFIFALPAQALTPNDDYYSELWYLPKIGAEEAWDTTTGSSEIVVAVLDAGFDMNHIDLEDNLWMNAGEVAGNGLDDDGNGYVDDVHGWDFVDDDDYLGPDTSEGSLLEAVSHGSAVAGVIGAIGNNDEGVTGVNWDVSIMTLRTLNSIGVGDSYATAQAVDYAVANGADVINLSFSGDTLDGVLRDAVRDAYNAGVVVVAAMGNENINTDQTAVYPACFGAFTDEDWVIGVAATTETDEKASFSNFGANCVDISAPGVGFVGLGYYEPTEDYYSEYTGTWSGTSMAAPVVSGAAALVLSRFPDLTPLEIQNILQLSVDPVVLTQPLSGKMGAGRINIAKALEIAAEYSVDAVEEEIMFIRGESFSTVYAINDDGERLIVMDTNTYFTYEDSFDAVSTVSDAELANFDLGGVVLPKAGVVLVKIQSDPRVYALEASSLNPFAPRLREIASEEVAVDMYGANWSDYVIDIEPTFFTKFGTGSRINSPEIVDLGIMKTREELMNLAL